MFSYNNEQFVPFSGKEKYARQKIASRNIRTIYGTHETQHLLNLTLLSPVAIDCNAGCLGKISCSHRIVSGCSWP